MARIFFIGSLAFFAFAYGFAARHLSWFPGPQIVAAIQDFRTLAARAEPHHLPPIVHEDSGVTVNQASRTASGLTMVTSYWPEFDWGAGIRLIDGEGRVHHRWPVDADSVFPDSPPDLRHFDYIHGAYVFPNGDALFNIEMRGIARIDACGDVLWALENESHHSIERSEDGNFWVSGLARYTGKNAGDKEYAARFPGLKTPLFDDLLRQISPDGEELQTLSVLELIYENDLQRYLVKQNLRHSDVTHLNDIEALPADLAAEYPLFEAGDLVVSLRFPHLVFVVDPDTGVVKWHTSDPLIEQHDPDYIGDGWIGIFDNNQNPSARGAMLGGSRILGVRPHTGETRVLYPPPGAAPFYTAAGGKWQLLDNGNMLITEARAGRVFEAASDGTIVWEWIQQPYDERRVPEVLEGSRFPFTPDQVAEWRCSPDQA